LTMTGSRIRILVADQHALFREAVRGVLEMEPDLDVVAEAGDGLQAVEAASRANPDVALVDAHLPGSDGVRAAAMLGRDGDAPRVVILAAEGGVHDAIEAFSAGASGYLTKDRPLDELIEATRAVYRGEMLLPRPLLGPLLEELLRRRNAEDEEFRILSRLTRREREVLILLAGNADNESIARTLVISPQTARTHVQNVLGKLGVHSRLEAAALALRLGAGRHLVEVNR
jgi:DNA-binding NarL/FixJ family response regulator